MKSRPPPTSKAVVPKISRTKYRLMEIIGREDSRRYESLQQLWFAGRLIFQDYDTQLRSILPTKELLRLHNDLIRQIIASIDVHNLDRPARHETHESRKFESSLAISTATVIPPTPSPPVSTASPLSGQATHTSPSFPMKSPSGGSPDRRKPRPGSAPNVGSPKRKPVRPAFEQKYLPLDQSSLIREIEPTHLDDMTTQNNLNQAFCRLEGRLMTAKFLRIRLLLKCRDSNLHNVNERCCHVLEMGLSSFMLSVLKKLALIKFEGDDSLRELTRKRKHEECVPPNLFSWVSNADFFLTIKEREAWLKPINRGSAPPSSLTGSGSVKSELDDTLSVVSSDSYSSVTKSAVPSPEENERRTAFSFACTTTPGSEWLAPPVNLFDFWDTLISNEFLIPSKLVRSLILEKISASLWHPGAEELNADMLRKQSCVSKRDYNHQFLSG